MHHTPETNEHFNCHDGHDYVFKNHTSVAVMTCLFSNILQLVLLALPATTSLAPLLVVWPILFGGGFRLVFRTSVDLLIYKIFYHVLLDLLLRKNETG